MLTCHVLKISCTYGRTTDYRYNDYHVTATKNGDGDETRDDYNAGDSEATCTGRRATPAA